jgi:hypothetical protein
MVLLCLPAAAFGYIHDWKKCRTAFLRRVGGLYASLALGSALAGFYLFPALLDMQDITPDKWDAGVLNWHGAFVFPFITRLVFPVRWFTYQWIMPAAALAITVAVVIHLWNLRRSGRSISPLLLGLAVVSCVAFFFSSELSYPVWAICHSLEKVQFAYRFTYIQILAGILASFLCFKTARIPAALSILVSLAVTPLLVHEHMTARMPGYVEHLSRIQGLHGAPEYLPAHGRAAWMDYAHAGGFASECASKGVTCAEVESARNMQHRAWRILAVRATELRIPVFFYPAWQLRVDGRDAVKRYDSGTGLFLVSLTPGPHTVEVDWGTLRYAQTGYLCSLLALVLLAGLQCRPLFSSRRVRPQTVNDLQTCDAVSS